MKGVKCSRWLIMILRFEVLFLILHLGNKAEEDKGTFSRNLRSSESRKSSRQLEQSSGAYRGRGTRGLWWQNMKRIADLAFG